jgi:GNAT superfamily N-acetyltransferase
MLGRTPHKPRSMPTFSIREASPNEIDLVVSLRVAMSEETDETTLSAQLVEATRRWLGENTQRGIMRSWLAESDGKVVGTVSCRIRDTSPREHDLIGKEAYVHNLYVEPAYRSRGIGRALMQVLLDWCKDNGYTRVALRASVMGRPLYERMDFVADRSMVLKKKE